MKKPFSTANRRGARRAIQSVGLAWTLFVGGCSSVFNSEVHKGIGATCQNNGDCQAGTCEQGICCAACTMDSECPAPSKCFTNRCQRPLKVAGLYQGVITEGEGFNLTHHEGLLAAQQDLGFVDLSYKEGMAAPDSIATGVDLFASQGAEVIVGNSNAQLNALMPKIAEYPNIKFLVFAGFKKNEANLGSFFAYIEQAFYLAGKVAAQKAQTRLGFLAAYITPQVVRRINAFTLGARSVRPDLVVEVRWVGWWSDYRPAAAETFNDGALFREELIVEQLAASGAEVIAHAAANGRGVRRIESWVKPGEAPKVYSIANDNRNGWKSRSSDLNPNAPLASCMGAVYYNWQSVYHLLLNDIHRNAWMPSVLTYNITSSPDTVVGFEPNTGTGVDDSSIRLLVDGLAGMQGLGPIFKGPYATTGQRDVEKDGTYDDVQTVAEGETPSDAEISSMCWFVKGVVERSDPMDFHSPDRDALVPDAINRPLAKSDVLSPPGKKPGEGQDCTKNQ